MSGGPHKRIDCPEPSGVSSGGERKRGGATVAPQSRGAAREGFTPERVRRQQTGPLDPQIERRLRKAYRPIASEPTQQTRPGGATTATRMVHAGAATVSEESVVVETKPESQGQEGDRPLCPCVAAGLRENRKAETYRRRGAVCLLANHRRGHEQWQRSSRCGATAVSLFHGLHVPGAQRYGRWMLKTELDGGSGFSSFGEVGLRHLQQQYRGVTVGTSL